MHRHVLFVATALVLAATGSAQAQDAPAQWNVSGNIALTSDYLFRGLSQSSQDPALQGGIEAGHSSGWYAGVWGSNVSWLSDLSTNAAPISSSIEVDAYAGWRGNISESLKLDAGVYTYYYPGDFPHGFTKADTTEVYASLAWGVAALKYSYALTDTFGFADSEGSDYLELNVNWEFAPTWTLNAHAGHQRISELDAADYSDWKLGLTKGFDKGWTLALAYFDTNAQRSVYTNPSGEYLARATGVLTVTKTF